jgi:hypothetical protein
MDGMAPISRNPFEHNPASTSDYQVSDFSRQPASDMACGVF